MKTNIIPEGYNPLINLAALALAGAQAHGAAINLEHNTGLLIQTDYFALAGNPATPEVLGKQGLLNAQLLTIKTTTATANSALRDGRKFCQTGFGLLKPLLGHKWNTDWQAAGFVGSNLRVPRVPLSLLTQFRAYLEVNPTRESASAGFTAAAAQAHFVAIQNAIQARDTAKGARWSVKGARDAAFKQMRKRLSALRAELAQLLSKEDDRWYAFGFRRPADGRKPLPVSGLTLTGLGSGTVLVSWQPASLAENYRVTWKPTASIDPATEVGLFADTQATLTSLPAGVPLTIGVSARNDSGETAATEANVTL
jgi:hypothetical protein